MPKYNRHFHGDPTQVLERLDQEIRKSTYTISLVEESQTELSGVSCVLRLYEAYRIDGSRADMTIALMTDGCGPSCLLHELRALCWKWSRIR